MYALVSENNQIHTDSGYYSISAKCEQKEMLEQRAEEHTMYSDTPVKFSVKQVVFTADKTNHDECIVCATPNFLVCVTESELYSNFDITYDDCHADYYMQYLNDTHAMHVLVNCYLKVIV